MRSIVLAAIAALAVSTAAGATSPPYYMKHGLCTSPDGHTVPKQMCQPAAHAAAPSSPRHRPWRRHRP